MVRFIRCKLPIPFELTRLQLSRDVSDKSLCTFTSNFTNILLVMFSWFFDILHMLQLPLPTGQEENEETKRCKCTGCYHVWSQQIPATITSNFEDWLSKMICNFDNVTSTNDVLCFVRRLHFNHVALAHTVAWRLFMMWFCTFSQISAGLLHCLNFYRPHGTLRRNNVLGDLPEVLF